MHENIPLEIYERCFMLVEYIRENQNCRVSDLFHDFKGKYSDMAKNRYSSVDESSSEKSIKRSIQRDIKKLKEGFIPGVQIVVKGLTYMVEIQNENFYEQSQQNIHFLALSKAKKNLQHIISLDQRGYRGGKNIPLFIQALIQNKQVAFSFKEYERDKRLVKLSVFGLKQFDSRWYVVGRNHLSDNNHEVNRFDLDRCHNVKLLDKSTVRTAEDENFEINHFFDGAYGVIRGIEENREIERIVLKADYRQSCYLKSTPLHASQTWIDIDDNELNGSLFTLHLCPTYDFKMKILSMGTKVEVLEGLELRKEIIAFFNECVQMYHNNI